jgi:glutamate racemase
MSIAFFDSGMGGLSVLHEARKRIPDEEFIYYADTLHVPYGTKPKEQVKDFIMTSVSAIMEQPVPVKALVIACNTATSIAVQDLRKAYSIPIIGMEPAVKPAVELSRRSGRRVLVIATPLTLRESRYHELVNRVDDQSIVDSLPLPELVQYCERLQFDGEEIEAYFHRKLSNYHLSDYGTIVLGCTHFPFYRSLLTRLLPAHMNIVDGSRGTVRRLQEVVACTKVRSRPVTSPLRFISSNEDQSYVDKMKHALDIYASMEAGASG